MMTVQELRALLQGLPDDMPIGVAYPDSVRLDECHETTDVRSTRVTDPFHKFARSTKEVFVLEVY